jgi:hypothetical protein
MTTKDASSTDIYPRITKQIVGHLETEVRPWTQPWQSKGEAVSRPLRHNGEPFRYVGPTRSAPSLNRSGRGKNRRQKRPPTQTSAGPKKRGRSSCYPDYHLTQ